jgi:hypothetical protein
VKEGRRDSGAARSVKVDRILVPRKPTKDETGWDKLLVTPQAM